jgi:hypothetical protein
MTVTKIVALLWLTSIALNMVIVHQDGAKTPNWVLYDFR